MLSAGQADAHASHAYSTIEQFKFPASSSLSIIVALDHRFAIKISLPFSSCNDILATATSCFFLSLTN
jgi:hypothetical protein